MSKKHVEQFKRILIHYSDFLLLQLYTWKISCNYMWTLFLPIFLNPKLFLNFKLAVLFFAIDEPVYIGTLDIFACSVLLQNILDFITLFGCFTLIRLYMWTIYRN